MIFLHEIQKLDYPQREFASPPRCLLLPRPNPVTALVSFFFSLDGLAGVTTVISSLMSWAEDYVSVVGRKPCVKKGNIRR